MKNAILTALRFTVYTLVITGTILVMHAAVRCNGSKFFYENNLLEWMQFTVLLAVCLLFAWGSCNAYGLRRFLILMSMLAAFAATRELDSLLNRLMPVLSWKIGAVFLIYGMWQLIVRRKTFVPQILSFMQTPAFVVLWAGFIIAVPFAQLVGHRPFFRMFIEESQVRDIKRLFEETGEFIGYLILLFGTIETLILYAVFKNKNSCNGLDDKNQSSLSSDL
jgi:hypothetical protein